MVIIFVAFSSDEVISCPKIRINLPVNFKGCCHKLLFNRDSCNNVSVTCPPMPFPQPPPASLMPTHKPRSACSPQCVCEHIRYTDCKTIYFFLFCELCRLVAACFGHSERSSQIYFVSLCRNGFQWVRASSLFRLHDHSSTHHTR
jgi:hypothetical protein